MKKNETQLEVQCAYSVHLVHTYWGTVHALYKVTKLSKMRSPLFYVPEIWVFLLQLYFCVPSRWWLRCYGDTETCGGLLDWCGPPTMHQSLFEAPLNVESLLYGAKCLWSCRSLPDGQGLVEAPVYLACDNIYMASGVWPISDWITDYWTVS